MDPSIPMLPRIFEFLSCQPLPQSESLADRIRAFRESRGLSHNHLGALLGVHSWTIWNIERGEEPSSELADMVQEILLGTMPEKTGDDSSRGL